MTSVGRLTLSRIAVTSDLVRLGAQQARWLDSVHTYSVARVRRSKRCLSCGSKAAFRLLKRCHE